MPAMIRPRRSYMVVNVLTTMYVVSLLTLFQSNHQFSPAPMVADRSRFAVMMTSQENSAIVKSQRISSDALLYFDETRLREILVENVAFHREGGNLKSVQLFKDSAIDSTLEKQGIQFIPERSSAGTHKLVSHLNQYYKENYDPRGGYGRPLPGKMTPTSPVLSGDRWFDVIEHREGRQKWDAALGPIGPPCLNLTQLGDKRGDGFKYMCLPEKKQSTAQEECHIISIGGNDNWKFEIAAVDRLGCVTHTFDCTLPDGKPKRKPDRDDVKFYNYCIDGTTHTDSHGRQYLTYSDMLKTAGIETPPAYLKLDVEGFEYDIFTEMVQSPDLLPQQIQVELHWGSRMTGLSWMPRLRTSGEIALLAGMMFHAGFLPVHLDFNRYCTPCMEVLYFRALE